MKIFHCGTCGNVLFFENNRCMSCQRDVAFAVDVLTLTDIEPMDGLEDVHEAGAGAAEGRRYKRCKNDVDYGACNWLVEEDDPHPYCMSCRFNEVVPNLTEVDDRSAWLTLEQAKRRLMYSLYSLGLPVVSREEQPESGLAFKFLRSTEAEPVTTGHAQGIITLNIAEASSIFRENMREKLGEAYRTVLGHFRHEIGHYYWDQLVMRSERWLPRVREMFGDERQSYQDALTRHYEDGPPDDWSSSYISAYATMHPWEDWAETWAHYFHMVDTLETAASYGVAVQYPESGGRTRQRRIWTVDFEDFKSLRTQWEALTLALNSLNRSMGLPDLYPFALCETVYDKLEVVHEIILDAAAEAGVGEPPEPTRKTG